MNYINKMCQVNVKVMKRINGINCNRMCKLSEMSCKL